MIVPKNNNNKDYIAFYGTLKKDSANPFVKELSEKLSYVGSCVIKGKLYDIGRLPALKLGRGRVKAELFEILDKSIIPKLDDYEAIDNINTESPGYRRVLTRLITPHNLVWVYEYCGKPKQDQLIKSGEWSVKKNLRVILALRTDTEQAELYLFTADGQKIDKKLWTAGRSLADELLPYIQELFKRNYVNTLDLHGIVVFTGEGSFTGLRIGTTVANTLAYSLNIPVVKSNADDWIKSGLKRLSHAKTNIYVVPKYSKGPNITKPKK